METDIILFLLGVTLVCALGGFVGHLVGKWLFDDEL